MKEYKRQLNDIIYLLKISENKQQFDTALDKLRQLRLSNKEGQKVWL